MARQSSNIDEDTFNLGAVLEDRTILARLILPDGSTLRPVIEIRDWNNQVRSVNPNPVDGSIARLDVSEAGNYYATVLAFDGHVDTVEVGDEDNWSFPPFSGEIKDGIVHGRGASDQKGGAASMLTAARILKDLKTYIRPPILRRFTYRLKHRKPVLRPYWLSDEYVGRVLDLEFPYARRLFDVSRVCDNEQYNRICTLELLLEKYQPTFADNDTAPA